MTPFIRLPQNKSSRIASDANVVIPKTVLPRVFWDLLEFAKDTVQGDAAFQRGHVLEI